MSGRIKNMFRPADNIENNIENNIEDDNEVYIDLLPDEPESVVQRWFNYCLVPFHWLLLPIDRLFEWLVNPAEEDADALDDPSPEGLGPRVKHGAHKLAGFCSAGLGLLLVVPWRGLRNLSQHSKRELLACLPVVCMLCFFAFVLYQVVINADAIERKYRVGAQAALESGNFALAKTYFSRIEGTKNFSRGDRLQFAIVLGQTGHAQRAEQILAELAPEDTKGYPPAHRLRALSLLTQLNQSQEPLLLQRLRWHLEQGNDRSEPILKAWAAYYLAINDIEKGAEMLQQAASQNPELLIAVADIWKSQGNTQRMLDTLKSAKLRFQELVARDALDSQARIHLAGVLLRLEAYDDAERVLLAGYKLQPDAAIKRSLADCYIVRYDLAVAESLELQQRFDLLSQALKADPQNLAAFQRIAELYEAASSAQDAASIKTALVDIVTSSQPSALSHLALSNFLWMEQKFDDAQWHVEQAYRLEPRFTTIINNLAWMLAHQESPDLDRALQLAKTALDKSPQDPIVLDTYGTVLLFQKEYEQAIAYFEKALPHASFAPELHRKLGICYRQIGRLELADMHDAKAQP